MIPDIDQNAFAARLADEGALVIDVREAHEFAAAHVPGATNVPLGRLPALLADLPRDRPVYVICQSGNRSARATELMRDAGIRAVNVAGGTGEWLAAGRPVERAA